MNTKTQRKQLLKFLKKIAPFAKFLSELSEDTIVVVSAVEDFDPKSNDVWRVEKNKSYSRDVVCGKCKRQVVMSDGLFEMFEKKNRQQNVLCGKCFHPSLYKNDLDKTS